MSGISNHYDCMTAIKTIVDANVGVAQGLTGGCVIQEVARYLDNLGITLPFISLSPWDERLQDENSLEDGPGYGVMLAIVGDQSLSQLETRLGWRQTLRKKIHNRPLTAVPANYIAKVEPGEVVNLRAWWQQSKFVSNFLIRCQCEEARG